MSSLPTRLTLAAAVAVTAAAATGCGSGRQAASEAVAPVAVATGQTQPIGMAVPRAVIYRTSMPADSLVPVTVRGGELVAYPAPSDLTEAPARLSDGWLLDTRGIGPDTRFTRWTYAEYKALPDAPSPDEVMKALVPGITVTEIVTLPMATGSATPEQADALIADGLKGCNVIYRK